MGHQVEESGGCHSDIDAMDEDESEERLHVWIEPHHIAELLREAFLYQMRGINILDKYSGEEESKEGAGGDDDEVNVRRQGSKSEHDHECPCDVAPVHDEIKHAIMLPFFVNLSIFFA